MRASLLQPCKARSAVEHPSRSTREPQAVGLILGESGRERRSGTADQGVAKLLGKEVWRQVPTEESPTSTQPLGGTALGRIALGMMVANMRTTLTRWISTLSRYQLAAASSTKVRSNIPCSHVGAGGISRKTPLLLQPQRAQAPAHAHSTTACMPSSTTENGEILRAPTTNPISTRIRAAKVGSHTSTVYDLGPRSCYANSRLR
mmetsp:Transcript_76943/g.160089  ORF Transcript_76943/g.160089 Transcript_76943/m.160089 type:complete len:204 (+) Transcript_76943:372-983(+)